MAHNIANNNNKQIEHRWWYPAGGEWAYFLEEVMKKHPWTGFFIAPLFYLPLQILRWFLYTPAAAVFKLFNLNDWEQRFNAWERAASWGIGLLLLLPRMLLFSLIFLRSLFAHPWFGKALGVIVAVGLGFIAWQFALPHFAEWFAITLGVVSGAVNASLYWTDIPKAFREILTGQIFQNEKGGELTPNKQFLVLSALLFSIGTGAAIASISFNASVVAMTALVKIIFGIAVATTPPGVFVLAAIITVASFIGISANIYRTIATNFIKKDTDKIWESTKIFFGFDKKEWKARHYIRFITKILFVAAAIAFVIFALIGATPLWQTKLTHQIFQGFFGLGDAAANAVSWAVVGGLVLGTRFLFLARACLLLTYSIVRPFAHPLQTWEKFKLYWHTHSAGEIFKDSCKGFIAFIFTGLNAIANFFLATPGTPEYALIGTSVGSFAINRKSVKLVVGGDSDELLADEFLKDLINEYQTKLDSLKFWRAVPLYGFFHKRTLSWDINLLGNLISSLKRGEIPVTDSARSAASSTAEKGTVTSTCSDPSAGSSASPQFTNQATYADIHVSTSNNEASNVDEKRPLVTIDPTRPRSQTRLTPEDESAKLAIPELTYGQKLTKIRHAVEHIVKVERTSSNSRLTLGSEAKEKLQTWLEKRGKEIDVRLSQCGNLDNSLFSENLERNKCLIKKNLQPFESKEDTISSIR